jgi:glutaconyl-CoA/methylmalonyl-CoA decarboxylase subunit gamma
MTQRQGYRIRVGEREHEVEVEVDADGERRVFVDGRLFEVADAGGHTLRVSLQPGREQVEVTLAGKPGEPRPSEAWVTGERVRVVVQTEQEARLARALGKSATGAGSGSLIAPMPGRVVKILVSEGEVVVHGAPALIVEAMKMENELHAPTAGVVQRVAVREGDTVDAGQVLLEITAPSETQPTIE